MFYFGDALIEKCYKINSKYTYWKDFENNRILK